MKPTDQRPLVPRGVSVLVVMLVSLTVLGVAAARIVSPLPVTAEPAVVVAARDLRFEDRPDGGIVVSDADTGRRVTAIAPQTGEFIRITMRGLVHARKRWSADTGTSKPVPVDAPFRLAAGADGRLTLRDPVTGRLIELEAFGSTNAGSFAQLLAAPESAP